MVQKFTNKQRPYVMSIAGFDPCGGAGLSADLKTFETCQVTGLGVLTCNTIQNSQELTQIRWEEESFIKAQLELMLNFYPVNFIKIGIIQNKTMLMKICDCIKTLRPQAKIIWDPIIATSSGFVVHNALKSKDLDALLGHFEVITPNYDEAVQLWGTEVEFYLKQAELPCAVLLKGGHHPRRKGIDQLFSSTGITDFAPQLPHIYPKHGSGCILSAALTAYLAKGNSLINAIYNAKKYTENCLISNSSLLAYHAL